MKIKRLLTLGALLLVSTVMLNAQPTPPQGADNQAEQSMNRTPVGTATALLLGLGAGVLGYRLRKNTKDSNE
ncbi:MAG: hypothetical protein IJ681_09385 [Bacteroidales bacterium]|nr:hypothetical protein [Bacteroidales bacterium]